MLESKMPEIIDYMNKFRLYSERGEIEKAIFVKTKCREFSIEGIEKHEIFFDYFLYSVGSGRGFGEENFEILMKLRNYSMYCESVLAYLRLKRF